MTPVSLHTERLLLRPWRDEDREPFAAMCADPQVMEFFPSTLTREECDRRVDIYRADFRNRGWGLWAVEAPGVLPFAGFIGLNTPKFDAPFTPAVEIGWRLARSAWGQGYATEGARAAVGFGFRHLELAEIVSFTVVANARSRRVMERLGMTHDPREDFDHPLLPEGHPLSRHVLYRLKRK